MLARCKALVTNDDGIDSPGLVALAAAAVAAGLEVVVAAPARQSSGASAGIIATTRQGQTLIERRQLADLPGVEVYAVDAQLAYIVRAAIRGWLDPAPELVLAGVNHGANVGRAILHSGTRRSGADRRVERLVWAGRVARRRLAPGRRAALVHRRAPVAGRPGIAGWCSARHRAHVETQAPPAAGTDSALLAAGHPTLTALESVCEVSGPAIPQWLASAIHHIG